MKQQLDLLLPKNGVGKCVACHAAVHAAGRVFGGLTNMKQLLICDFGRIDAIDVLFVYPEINSIHFHRRKIVQV